MFIRSTTNIALCLGNGAIYLSISHFWIGEGVYLVGIPEAPNEALLTNLARKRSSYFSYKSNANFAMRTVHALCAPVAYSYSIVIYRPNGLDRWPAFDRFGWLPRQDITTLSRRSYPLPWS